MKPIERLRKILKTVPKVKDNMEVLQFGCEIEFESLWEMIRDVYIEENCEGIWFDCINEKKWSHDDDIFEIIWTIKERHLRMYCDKKCLWVKIDEDWEIVYEFENWWRDDNWYLEYSTSIICQLDNTLNLDQQKDEVIEKICNFLEDNK